MNVLKTAKQILIERINEDYLYMRANAEEYGHAVFEGGIKKQYDEENDEWYELKDISTMIRDEHLAKAKKLNAQKKDRPYLNDDEVVHFEKVGKKYIIKTERQTWEMLSGRFGFYLRLKG